MTMMHKGAVIEILERRQEITKRKADQANASGNMDSYYRHNTALHELWKVQDLIQGKPVKAD